MNKVLLLTLFCVVTAIAVFGQDSTLREYQGKYTITSGRVSEVDIVADSLNLIINSAMGSATLVRGEGDKFNMVEYSGTVEFFRNADKKVTGIRISVMGLELEGTKVPDATFPNRLFVWPLALQPAQWFRPLAKSGYDDAQPMLKDQTPSHR
jgi:hypothetical protein